MIRTFLLRRKHRGSRHRDSRHRDSRHGDSRHGDSKHGDSKHGDSKHGDSKHGDSKHGHSKGERPIRVSVAVVGLTLLLQVAGGASGQEPPRRPGVQREVVVQLAYALGEAHALHRLCAGPADATWYARMERLETQEASDEASRHQLVDAFNAGFAARQAQALTCGRRSRAAEKAVAARGATLARRLAAAETEPS